MDEYDVLIDDLDMEESVDLTKEELQRIFNKRLSEQWSPKDCKDGIELDLKPEWKKVLAEDGTVLWDYQKLGWKVMQYRQGRRDGTAREWISFVNPKFKNK